MIEYRNSPMAALGVWPLPQPHGEDEEHRPERPGGDQVERPMWPTAAKRTVTATSSTV